MSIYKRASGRWAVLVDLESSATGLRRRKSIGTYRTRKDAEAAERKALESRERGIDLSAKTCTVKELLDRFVSDRRAKDRALRTIMNYEDMVRLYIAPHLGSLVLAKLSPAHVSTWMATLREKDGVSGKPLSPKSTKHAYALLSSALRWAVRHDLLWRNVCEAVDAPTVPRSQARALDEDEAARFFAVADNGRFGPFFRLALGVGARRGELLALRWEDVCIPDVGKATLTIQRAFVEGKRMGPSIIEKGTKTNRVRTIRLCALAVDALRRQWAAQTQERRDAGDDFDDSGHVFQQRHGGPVRPWLATEAFRTATARAKVKATLHDLRHTSASWMLAAGVDVTTVAKMLGHTTPSTTLGIYAHTMPDSEAKAVAKIDQRLKRAKKGA